MSREKIVALVQVETHSLSLLMEQQCNSACLKVFVLFDLLGGLLDEQSKILLLFHDPLERSLEEACWFIGTNQSRIIAKRLLLNHTFQIQSQLPSSAAPP
jgi:hypothetical protein